MGSVLPDWYLRSIQIGDHLPAWFLNGIDPKYKNDIPYLEHVYEKVVACEKVRRGMQNGQGHIYQLLDRKTQLDIDVAVKSRFLALDKESLPVYTYVHEKGPVAKFFISLSALEISSGRCSFSKYVK